MVASWQDEQDSGMEDYADKDELVVYNITASQYPNNTLLRFPRNVNSPATVSSCSSDSRILCMEFAARDIFARI